MLHCLASRSAVEAAQARLPGSQRLAPFGPNVAVCTVMTKLAEIQAGLPARLCREGDPKWLWPWSGMSRGADLP